MIWTMKRQNIFHFIRYKLFCFCTKQDNFWVGYDDEDMVREKAHYVVEEGMGGIMFWTIDNDDFRGACGLRPFPLIESAKEALYGKEGTFKT